MGRVEGNDGLALRPVTGCVREALEPGAESAYSSDLFPRIIADLEQSWGVDVQFCLAAHGGDEVPWTRWPYRTENDFSSSWDQMKGTKAGEELVKNGFDREAWADVLYLRQELRIVIDSDKKQIISSGNLRINREEVGAQWDVDESSLNIFWNNEELRWHSLCIGFSKEGGFECLDLQIDTESVGDLETRKTVIEKLLAKMKKVDRSSLIYDIGAFTEQQLATEGTLVVDQLGEGEPETWENVGKRQQLLNDCGIEHEDWVNVLHLKDIGEAKLVGESNKMAVGEITIGEKVIGLEWEQGKCRLTLIWDRAGQGEEKTLTFMFDKAGDLAMLTVERNGEEYPKDEWVEGIGEVRAIMRLMKTEETNIDINLVELEEVGPRAERRPRVEERDGGRCWVEKNHEAKFWGFRPKNEPLEAEPNYFCEETLTSKIFRAKGSWVIGLNKGNDKKLESQLGVVWSKVGEFQQALEEAGFTHERWYDLVVMAGGIEKSLINEPEGTVIKLKTELRKHTVWVSGEKPGFVEVGWRKGEEVHRLHFMFDESGELAAWDMELTEGKGKRWQNRKVGMGLALLGEMAAKQDDWSCEVIPKKEKRVDDTTKGEFPVDWELRGVMGEKSLQRITIKELAPRLVISSWWGRN